MELEYLFGIYLYQKEKVQDSNKLTKQLASIEQSKNITESANDMVLVSIEEVKTSPNCTIEEKQYFNGCDHLIKNIKEIPEEWINSTKEQIEAKYPNWKMESFTNNQVIVSQEKDGYCPQHYVVREHNGRLGIYTLNENGKESFKEDTEIATRYLSDEDIEKLNDGIKAIGDDQLHTILEDFE